VVPSHDDNVPTGRGGNSAQKTVIELLGAIAGSTGVKNVTCHQQGLDFILLNCICQPDQKRFKFFVPFSTIKGSANVPVGCMKDSHNVTPTPLKWSALCILRANFSV
jgi:hypothetical protein